jgi:hypothetical protein
MRGCLSTNLPSTCATCEIEIVGKATFHVGLPFCCAGCVAGGPCTCSYDRSQHDPRFATISTWNGDEGSLQVVESAAGRPH